MGCGSKDLVFLDRAPVWQCAEIEVVSGEVVGWPCGRPADFGRLQGRLDDAGAGDRNLVLQIEDIFERAVEAVGPEMRTRFRLDQLCRDANPPARLAYGAFEDIAHSELASDLLHVYRLTFVGKG